MEALILRLEGPMMSFGAPIVDNHGVIQEHPPLSMLTGLIGNALGYRHGEFDRLQSLQGRIRFAARRDRAGETVTDFQTADLDQDFLKRTGWTTRGEREDRRGGAKTRKHPHLRYRQYVAGARYTVALSLEPDDGLEPSLDSIAKSLRHPARPLFIGRKTCLPSAPLLAGRTEAKDVLRALKAWPAEEVTAEVEVMKEAWWPADLDKMGGDTRELTVSDQRDWANQVHTGQRTLQHGLIPVSGDGKT